MLKADAPRMQMQLVLDALRQLGAAAIFLVAEDGMTEYGHMGAELVLPSGDGLERDEGDRLPRPVHDRVMGHRRLGDVLLAWARLAHAVAFGPRRLDQGRLDLPLRRLRPA